MRLIFFFFFTKTLPSPALFFPRSAQLARRSRINGDLIKDYSSMKIKINRAIIRGGEEAQKWLRGAKGGTRGGIEEWATRAFRSAANSLNYTKSEPGTRRCRRHLVEAYRVRRNEVEDKSAFRKARRLITSRGIQKKRRENAPHGERRKQLYRENLSHNRVMAVNQIFRASVL